MHHYEEPLENPYWEDGPFGQNADAHQLIAIVGMLVSTTLLYFAPAEFLIRLACGMLPISLFWFVVPGHALIYGPHLWVLLLHDMLRRS